MLAICLQKHVKGVCLRYKTVYFVTTDNVFLPFVTRKTLDTIDGEYAGNCSFESKSGSRRVSHRAGIGIALYQKYTGLGLGRIILMCFCVKLRKVNFHKLN